MNERDDNAGGRQGERGRDTNDNSRDFYPGSHGFDEPTHGAYGGWAPSGRDRGFGRASPQRQYDQQRHEPERHRNEQHGQRPYGWQDPQRAGRRYGQPQWRQPQYGQPQHGQGQSAGRFPRDEYGHEHSSEQLFGREPFARQDEPHYYGTGTSGWGGPGFTGGAYAYGDGPPEQPRLPESEYSDESALSYGRGYPRSYGRGWDGGSSRYDMAPRERPFPRGPKGYQRSDERLKEDISERLWEAWHINSSEVSVHVEGAKVILEGVVPDRRMKHAIEDLVDACPGVQDIDNRVRVGRALQGTGAVGTPSTGMGSAATAAAGTSNGSKVR